MKNTMGANDPRTTAAIVKLINTTHADYLKWDNNFWINCNRSGHGHGASDGNFAHVQALYALLDDLRQRFPEATVVQADAYRLRESLSEYSRHGASAIVSGLPLMTKPLRMRLRLLREALALLAPQAPFVQFTYAVVPPIPKLAGVKVEASERIWRNMPPARVWVYRHA